MPQHFGAALQKSLDISHCFLHFPCSCVETCISAFELSSRKATTPTTLYMFLKVQQQFHAIWALPSRASILCVMGSDLKAKYPVSLDEMNRFQLYCYHQYQSKNINNVRQYRQVAYQTHSFLRRIILSCLYMKLHIEITYYKPCKNKGHLLIFLDHSYFWT